MKQTIEDCGNGWFRPGASLKIVAFRTGWRGAWDAFKAALFRDSRMQVPATVTFSMYVKRPPDEFVIWGGQLENWNEKEI